VLQKQEIKIRNILKNYLKKLKSNGQKNNDK
jgi:hypothetical protein